MVGMWKSVTYANAVKYFFIYNYVIMIIIIHGCSVCETTFIVQVVRHFDSMVFVRPTTPMLLPHNWNNCKNLTLQIKPIFIIITIIIIQFYNHFTILTTISLLSIISINNHYRVWKLISQIFETVIGNALCSRFHIVFFFFDKMI